MNDYGYKADIQDPKIREQYFRFKERKGIPRHIPMSDKERFEFEDYIFGRTSKGMMEEIAEARRIGVEVIGEHA